MSTSLQEHLAAAIDYYLSAADILKLSISEEDKKHLNDFKNDIDKNINSAVIEPKLTLKNLGLKLYLSNDFENSILELGKAIRELRLYRDMIGHNNPNLN